MLKSELIHQLAGQVPEVRRELIRRATDSLLKTMTQALIHGDRIEIRGFGCFSLRYNNARLATDFQKKQLFTTAPKHRVHFKAAKRLQKRINELNVDEI